MRSVRSEHGHTVTLFHRGRTPADLPDAVQHLLGDREQLLDYQPTFAQLAPDVVLDMFAGTEAQGNILMQTFRNITGRVVVISSGDVHRAYDRLRKRQPEPPDPVPLTGDAPLREQLYPYRATASGLGDPDYHYDKILLERAVLNDLTLAGTVLRLPMVYGPRDRQHRLFHYLKRMDARRPAILLDARHAQWRWTRGYVENVAAAIVLAVTDQRAAGRIYNVGEVPALTEAEWVQAIGQVARWLVLHSLACHAISTPESMTSLSAQHIIAYVQQLTERHYSCAAID
jgi:nucleoside-diphosphate-sugar epimerase